MDSRRLVYLFMLLVIAVPILGKVTLPPARMVSAENMFEQLEVLKINPGQAAMVWLDFGPNTIAENQTQAEVVIEHLFRRRVPVVVMSQYQQSEIFLRKIPARIAERLNTEFPGQSWKYGEDWINAGYKPGSALFMQSLAKSSDISGLLAKDVSGTPLSNFPQFSKLKGLEDLPVVVEITGLMGVFDNIIQYLQKGGFKPKIFHGCTSITVPEAYIFLDSGQLNGLLEGLAGAAWYSQLLTQKNAGRGADTTIVRSTALSIAQMAILFLIVIGNLTIFLPRLKRAINGGRHD